MTQHSDCISTDGLRFEFNRNGGNITNLVIERGDGQSVMPLHAAPWTKDQSRLPDDIDRVERQLAGDFFCAPFGGHEGLPIHGWTANGSWVPKTTEQITDDDGSESIPGKTKAITQATYVLEQPVFGAQVTKRFTLVADHPFLYQSHRFSGGAGSLPIAHHAMVHVPGGARLSFSKKQFGATPTSPLETDPARGHSALSYPQRFPDLRSTLLADGTTADAGRYPFCHGHGHEDMVVLAEENATTIGWSAALARQDGFLFFAIKDARALPETLLWMSNGGRNYAPWSGRHTAVLGIEEAATACHDRGDFGSAPGLSKHGLACGLNLYSGTDHDIRYGFGAIPVPEGWSEIADIQVQSHHLILLDVGGDSLTLPFLGSHFGLS